MFILIITKNYDFSIMLFLRLKFDDITKYFTIFLKKNIILNISHVKKQHYTILHSREKCFLSIFIHTYKLNFEQVFSCYTQIFKF